MSEQARRYNSGKLAYGLLPTQALKAVAEVYTKGAHKYTLYKDSNGNVISGKDISLAESANLEIFDDGSDNWRKGLSWSKTIESAQRHIEQFKSGEDMDELGTLHLANAAFNILTVLEFYSIYPQGDDRKHRYLNLPKIGIDVDDVICDFSTAFAQRFNLPVPKNWNWSYKTESYFKELAALPEAELNDFYLSMKPKVNPDDIPFEPHCYITSRSIPSKAITEQWIEQNGFACKPVYQVPHNTSKVDVAKEAGVDIMIDDRFENFVELNNAGICCYLFDAPHNQRYNVGAKRIYDFKIFI